MTKIAAPFLPTIRLSGSVLTAVEAGTLKLRTGQWVTDGARKGQFICARNGVAFVSWLAETPRKREVEGFDGRTQRFCRAVWHQKRKTVGPMQAVLGAPRSLTLWDVKEWLFKAMGRKGFPRVVHAS